MTATALGCRQLPSHYALKDRKQHRDGERETDTETEEGRERGSKSYLEKSGKDLNVLKKDLKIEQCSEINWCCVYLNQNCYFYKN